MAPPTTSFTTQQAAAKIADADEHWGGDMGDPAQITFGYVDSGFRFSGGQIVAASAAVDLWAELANITFVETTDPDLKFENFRDDGSRAGASWSEDPDSQLDQDLFGRSGRVGFNRANGWGTDQLGLGEGNRESLIHEVGHALGLSHPGSYNAGSTGGPEITWENDADYFEDTKQYTVMSYFSEKILGANYDGVRPRTPLLHDIAAIQLMYGANIHTRETGTVYGFNSTAGPTYRLGSAGEKAVFSIWDAGGWDALDFSGYSGDIYQQEINLNANTFSSVGGLRYNISIALGVTIEAALGGAGRDQIYGNEVGNYLAGNGGDDDIFGGDGIDTISGGANKDTLFGGTENDILTGEDGNDVLNGDAGADSMRGGVGDDVYVVDDAGDEVVDEPGADGGLHDKIYTTLSSYNMGVAGKGEWVEELQFTGAGGFVGRGNALDNIIVGGAGRDRLYGNDGRDFLLGGADVDTLYGGIGNDRLDGEAGPDILVGGVGDDVYVVGQGDDVREDALGIFVGTGAASRYLAPGIDTVETSLARYSLGNNVENLTFTTNANGLNVGYGNALHNVLRGSLYGNDEFHGLAGNDTYYVDNPGDVVDETEFVFGGGTGPARRNGGYRDVGSDGDTVVTTLASYDLSKVGSNGVVRYLFPSTLYGVIENLTYAGTGNFNGIGNQANNIIRGGAGSDALSAGGGNDTVDGGVGNDGIDLGTGDDVAYIDNGTEAGGDVVVGGTGYDRVYAAEGVAGLLLNLFPAGTGFTPDVNGVPNVSAAIDVDFVQGSEGNDVVDGSRLAETVTLVGLGGADTLIGGAGNDLFYGGEGSDTVIGGGGSDGVDLGGGSDTAIIDNGTTVGGDVVVGGEGYDTVRADESTIATGLHLNLFPEGTGFTPDVNLVPLTSAAIGVERVQGNSGNDVIDAHRLASGVSVDGQAGDDTFTSGAGADQFYGGENSDTAIYLDARENYEISVALGIHGPLPGAFRVTDLRTGTTDSLFDVEAVQFGTGASQVVVDLTQPLPAASIIGTDGANSLIGTSAAELIDGRGGNNSLTGNAGADTLRGGLGDDTMSVDNLDVVDGGDGYDYANADTSTIAGGFRFDVAGTNVEAVQGNNGDDTIDATGVASSVTLVGHGGNDVLVGGDGDDGMFGFDGNDTLIGGAGFDQLHGGDGDDTIDGGGGPDNPPWTDWLFGGAGNDHLTGSGGGWVLGGEGDDTLFGKAGDLIQGDAGDDTIVGSAGTQQIVGSEGDDVMTGGADFDRFDFAAGWGHDRITDFAVGEDRLAFLGIPGLAGFGQLTVRNVAGETEIAFGNDTVLLDGILASQVSTENFVFG